MSQSFDSTHSARLRGVARARRCSRETAAGDIDPLGGSTHGLLRALQWTAPPHGSAVNLALRRSDPWFEDALKTPREAKREAGLRRFASDGAEIAYRQEGEGFPIVLVHGFAAEHRSNWERTGWLSLLLEAGRRVIALDLRGHGASDRPHERASYGRALSGDIVRLLDHLAIERADLLGYSLGGWISLAVLAEHPERVRACVLAGCGLRALGDARQRERWICALRGSPPPRPHPGYEESPQDRHETAALAALIAALGNDVEALAALLGSDFFSFCAGLSLPGNTRPVLLAAGDGDDLAPDPEALAARIAGSQVVRIPGANHFSTPAVPAFKEAVLEFLSARCR